MTLAEIIAIAAQDPSFIAGMSSNEIWYGIDTNTRLTDVCAILAQAIQGKADHNHTHDGYAAADHTHTGFAAADHAHEGYAAAEHTHTGFAAENHSHTGFAAEGHTHDGYAASDHTHTPASIGAAASNHSHSGYAAANHTHDYAAADHTHTGFAASGHTHTPASIGAAAASHTHDYAVADHTHTENVTVQKASGPSMTLAVNGVNSKAMVYKNASATADNGTTISDYASDGTRDSLILARGGTLANKLRLVVDHGGDETATYAIYGQHNKPTAADVGALPTSGGTVTGETNFSGGLVRLKGTQTLYHSGTQLIFGSNNLPTRIGGSAITATKSIQVDSDERLKEGISPVDAQACIDFVNGIDVKTFNYIGDSTPCMGVIAQDVQKSELAKFFVSVMDCEEQYLAVRATDMLFPLIVAFQKLSQRVAELEGKIR